MHQNASIRVQLFIRGKFDFAESLIYSACIKSNANQVANGFRSGRLFRIEIAAHFRRNMRASSVSFGDVSVATFLIKKIELESYFTRIFAASSSCVDYRTNFEFSSRRTFQLGGHGEIIRSKIRCIVLFWNYSLLTEWGNFRKEWIGAKRSMF